MDNSSDILNELLTISPLLAGMQKVNVFTVPAGYFQSLELDIMRAVKETPALFNNNITPVLNDVPQGYFESLADNILNKIKAHADTNEELKELSPALFNLPQQNVFTVPDGYFESFSATVLNRINDAENANEELNILSPALLAAKSKNVFTVPEGYFESLPAAIVNSITPQQAKLVSMRKRSAAAFIKYAVAAVFTGAMAMGVYQFTGNSNTPAEAVNYSGIMKTNVDGELAKISDDDIVSFLTKDGVDIDAAVAISQIQDKVDAATDTDKTDSNEIDELLNQLDESKNSN